MLDSLRYGIPGGLFAFITFWAQMLYAPEVAVYLRWSAVGAIVLIPSILTVRAKNRAYFPFRYAFLSGFNVLFISVLVSALSMLLLGGDIFIKRPDEIEPLQWTLYIVYQESVGLLAVSIFELAVLSFIFKQKPHE